MKKNTITAIILFMTILFFASGCQQPGETRAETARRRKRIARLDRQLLADDVEAVFHMDRPTRLSTFRTNR